MSPFKNLPGRSGAYRVPLLKLSLIVSFISLLLFSGCSKFRDIIDDHDDEREMDLKLLVDNLVSPLTVVDAPGEKGRLFVVDQIGQIWVLNKNGNKLPTPFLDVRDRMVTLNPNFDERGLLGLAFHPHYKNNGKFYVYYSATPTEGSNVNNIGTISEFTVSQSNPNVADNGSERILLEVPDPQGNHNGGTIAFGPDNYLYIAIGDGGGANDTAPGHVDDWYETNEGGNGQDIVSNLMGNILRIDVDSRSARMEYGIPSDNPFVNKEGRDEIYAFGLRNPYRFSFDMGGQHWLIAGDVGQRLYEEIDVIVKGGNFGWNVKEGRHCFDAANPTVPLADCPDQDTAGRPLIDPVIEITNINNPDGGLTSAVIGGHVYRGWDINGLHGKYIFGFLSQGGDQPDGKLLVTTPSDANSWTYEDLKLKSFPTNLGQYVKGFGQDRDGEIYVTTGMGFGPGGNSGKVYKLVEVKK